MPFSLTQQANHMQFFITNYKIKPQGIFKMFQAEDPEETGQIRKLRH